MVKLRYVGPFDEVEVTDGVQIKTVRQGEALDVSAELAGKPADPKVGAIADEIAKVTKSLGESETEDPGELLDKLAQLRAELAATDFGEGLLAQPDNWQPEGAKTSKTSKDGEA